MDRKQQIELTNMCLIYDENRILVEEKRKTKYVGGLVFPGGHIEPGESLLQSVIREMKEETGLDIYEPQPCGFKDWIQDDGTRYIVLLYKTNKFSGTLKSSEEGKVFWLDRKDIDGANLFGICENYWKYLKQINILNSFSNIRMVNMNLESY